MTWLRRLELRRSEELDLVYEKDHAGVAILRGFPKRDEKISDVVAQVAGIGHAFDRRDVDPGAKTSIGRRTRSVQADFGAT